MSPGDNRVSGCFSTNLARGKRYRPSSFDVSLIIHRSSPSTVSIFLYLILRFFLPQKRDRHFRSVRKGNIASRFVINHRGQDYCDRSIIHRDIKRNSETQRTQFCSTRTIMSGWYLFQSVPIYFWERTSILNPILRIKFCRFSSVSQCLQIAIPGRDSTNEN